MSLYFDSKQKIRNIRRSIAGLLDGDFPIESGTRALTRIRRVFDDAEKKLDRAHKLNDHISEQVESSVVNLKIYESLPILGFILRSTNVRNAFELLEPLQCLADQILQGSPQLLLSSEWDYVPFAYPQSIDDLKSFVLIGLPASEANSALLVPLAGHELGHAVWRNRGISPGAHATIQFKCEDFYNDDLDNFKKAFPDYNPGDFYGKEVLPEAIAQSVDIAMFQAEELFSDMFAYAVFGESFVHAFCYILSPGTGRSLGMKHPSHRTRISTLGRLAAAEGVSLPSFDDLGFREQPLPGNSGDKYILRKAESSVDVIIDALWGKVKELVLESGITRPNLAASQSHKRAFEVGVPASTPACVGDVINAGWMCYREIQRERISVAETAARIDSLNEMVLKTIEVLEFRRRIDGARR